MKAGRDRAKARAQLERGLRPRKKPLLYVRRRTSKRGQDRVLVQLPASLRYALCVWASYRPSERSRAVSQELSAIIWEGLRRRLGPDAEAIIVEAYLAYTKQLEEDGEENIFEVPDEE